MRFSYRIGKAAPQRIIVIGAGEVGFRIAQRLSRENQLVVVVDLNSAKLAAVRNALDVQILHGSGSNPAVLDQAGVKEADIVLAVTDSDEVNLLACLIANLLNPLSLKLARVRDEDYAHMDRLLEPDLLNISALINPDAEVVASIERMIRLPRAVDHAEFGNGRIKVIAIQIQGGPLPGKPLSLFPSIAQDRNVRVAGILRGERLLLPGGHAVIHQGDVVYFVCREDSLSTVLRIADAEVSPIRHILIVGGGNLGLKLALRLESQNRHKVKLMDRDADRCGILADKLLRTTVLHGDATDRELMREENVGSLDMVIALTGDEETNVLTCLLAKSLGTRKTITRVNKGGYLPIVRAIGIELSVNPRLAATNSIMRFIRRGMVLSSLATQDEDVEMLEAVVQDNSALAGTPLKDLAFPKGANLLALLREREVVIPQGDTVPRVGDRVILICDRDQVAWVETLLAGKGNQ